MSTAVAPQRPDHAAQVAASAKLLATVCGLPPSGSGLAALRRSDGSVAVFDLFAVGPLGDQRNLTVNQWSAGAAALVAALTARPALGAAVLAHSPHLAAWALARRPLPSRYSPLLRLTDAAEIPITRDGIAGGPGPVTSLLASDAELRAILVADYGGLVLGKDLPTAARGLASLEEAAQLAWAATAIGGSQPFPDDAAARVARGIAGADPGAGL